MFDDDLDEALPPGSESERTAALMATVRDLTSRGCRVCGRPLCGHEAVLAVLLGSRDAARCRDCAASEMAESSAELTERSLQWIQRRDCFYEAWLRAGDDEGLGRVDRPSCLFTASSTAAPTVEHAAVATDSPPPHDAELDAGDLGCGDLVIELKFRLADLAPGTVLRLTARDPAAPVDLPAWCGLVGHTLLHSSHPLYWIRRKQP